MKRPTRSIPRPTNLTTPFLLNQHHVSHILTTILIYVHSEPKSELLNLFEYQRSRRAEEFEDVDCVCADEEVGSGDAEAAGWI